MCAACFFGLGNDKLEKGKLRFQGVDYGLICMRIVHTEDDREILLEVS